MLHLSFAVAVAADACASAGDTGFCRSTGSGASSLSKPQLPTPALCCSACAAAPRCGAWTHYALNNGTLECNLLSGGGKRHSGNCTSALATNATPAPTPTPAPQPPPPPAGAKNVLWFIVDDLRTQAGAYGHPESVTPHMDALAASGARFTHAYVQQAVCAPSRGSFMTGLRPDALRIWTFTNNFRQTAGPDWVSLPQHFKDNAGYAPVLGGGKTFHPGRPANYDEPHSWTQELPYFAFYEPGCPTNSTLEPGSNGYTHSVCPLDGPLSQFFEDRKSVV